ncbi:hypothetical protein [Burkholderia pseudomallei]|uniref:hypothetical protein n=1 Tax=Burkholderia pseudomallei TaxID=28450 RepID=UPI000A1A1589|nr:hypothetical protein [Burkholderia pseudomallei]ARL97314.1 hypothetical protein BOC58_32020 [Burkholderia pseudomallei]
MPDLAAAWREQHQLVWLFNPWTGHERERLEIARDADGRLLAPPGEEPAVEWDPRFVKARGADRALGQLELAGWTGELDALRLEVTVSRSALVRTFRLTEPMDEERFYTLLHDEALRRLMR